MLAIPLVASAQINTGEIVGTILDTADSKPVKFATISVYSAADTILQSYALTDNNGRFKIKRLPTGIKLRIVITHATFKVLKREFLLAKGARLDLGSIRLQAGAQDLQQVTVTAERPPVSVRNDTIEFNASAFKMLPSAVLEDLLKKLPGLDVNQDGTIYANGKPVNRILVEGRRFFDSESAIALKNLPANIIDKVQVMDDKEQIRRTPDINPNEVGQVINLKLKNNIRKGYFGKAYAGRDLNEHREAGVLVNSFRDTLQLSLIGYENNVNKPGFASSDVQQIGGFQRNSSNNNITTTGGGYSINGISFGGTGQGLQTSLGGGLNFNTLLSKNIKLNALYFYGNIKSNFEQSSNRVQFLQDTVLSSLNKLFRNSQDQFHKVASNLEWQVDSSMLLTFRPEFNYKTRQSNSNSFYNTSSNYGGKLNETILTDEGEGTDVGYGHSLTISKTYKRKRQSLTFNHSLATSSNKADLVSVSDNSFYWMDSLEKRQEQDQYRQRPAGSMNIYSGVYYSQPINQWLSINGGGNNSFVSDRQSVFTFENAGATSQYDSLNDTLSNKVSRNGMRNNISGGLTFRIAKKLSLTAGANLLWIDIRNDNNKTGRLNQNYFYKTPQLNLIWNKINLNYQVSITEPSITDLQTVVDNSNTLYQQVGNPALIPTKVHRTTLNLFDYDFGRQMYYSIYANADVSEDAIARERFVDSKGVQISRPVNVNGVKQIAVSSAFSFTAKMTNPWKLQYKPGVFSSYSKMITILNSIKNVFSSYTVGASGQIVLSFDNLFEVTPKYTISYRKTNRSSTASLPNYVLTHSLESSATFRPFKNWFFESNINYRYNPEMGTGFRKSVTLINSSLSFLFLNQQKGQVKLSVNDLLNQNANIYRFVSENYILETLSNTLKRYVMISFVYNIRQFK